MTLNAIMLTIQWLTLGYMIWLYEKSERQHKKHMKELDEHLDSMTGIYKTIKGTSVGE